MVQYSIYRFRGYFSYLAWCTLLGATEYYTYIEGGSEKAPMVDTSTSNPAGEDDAATLSMAR